MNITSIKNHTIMPGTALQALSAARQNNNYNTNNQGMEFANIPMMGNVFNIPMSPSFGSRLETYNVHKPIIKEGLN